MLESTEIHTIANIFILALLVATSLAVAFSRNLLAATIYLSVFSLLMALMYVILNAPDVAITEAAIGAGIGTILFLSALLLTGEKENSKPYGVAVITLFVVTGGALFYAMIGLPSWGDAMAPSNSHVAPYYINNTYNDIGIPNIVTAILASYRGFDTMGEVVVVFTACMIIYSLLHGRTVKPYRKDKA
jgi:multicomponent Na+:H+ antiporter subunit B